jgi:uncharacterized protein
MTQTSSRYAATALFMTLSLVLSACGGSAPAKEPTSEPAATKSAAEPTKAAAEPTKAAEPAKATDVPAVAPTPLPAKPTKATQVVDAMWFSRDGNGQAIGGTSSTKVAIEPNPEGKFRLGIFENEVFGTGDQWRATAWTATIVAALLTNTDLSKSQVSWDVAGRIDGPSAGGLMTSAVIAALRGKKIREDATMTGTINPDGTIGPVGGIPHKIEGASKKGKKLILVPSGQRYDYDQNKQASVDLVELGRTLNVEVKEVADVYQAYNLLTGDELPKLARSNARPEVSPQVFNRMQAKTREWNARYSEVLGRTVNLNPKIKALLDTTGFVETAAARSKKAEDYLNQGLPAAAYDSARQAVLYISAYEKVARLVEVYLSEGFEGTAAILQSEAIGGKVSAAADLLKSETPKTVSDANALILSYGYLSQGLASWLTGQNILANTLQQIKAGEQPLTQEQELVRMVYIAVYYEAADLFIETSKDAIVVGAGQPGSPLPADIPLEETADFFRRAAEANFALFDSTVIGPQIAEPRGISTEAAKSALKGVDIDYGLGLGALEAIGLLDSYFKDPKAYQYAKLGAAMQAYSVSTQMIAKYYSLGAQMDDSMNVTGFGNEKALLNMLDLADEQSRYSMNALKENGEDVSMFAILYEGGRVGREGDASAKLNALGEYWRTFIESRAISYLMRLGQK